MYSLPVNIKTLHTIFTILRRCPERAHLLLTNKFLFRHTVKTVCTVNFEDQQLESRDKE